MADLSTIIEYDKTYPVVIRNPITGEDEGVRVNVVSQDSRRVVDALRKANSDYWRAVASADKDAPQPEMPDSGRITLIHCIDSWDWADSSFAHVSGSGPASLEDREFIIDHPNAKWFVDQLAMGCANIENFSQVSSKTARRGSKKT